MARSSQGKIEFSEHNVVQSDNQLLFGKKYWSRGRRGNRAYVSVVYIANRNPTLALAGHAGIALDPEQTINGYSDLLTKPKRAMSRIPVFKSQPQQQERTKTAIAGS